jgi:hypothetical protein
MTILEQVKERRKALCRAIRDRAWARNIQSTGYDSPEEDWNEASAAYDLQRLNASEAAWARVQAAVEAAIEEEGKIPEEVLLLLR